MLATRFTATFKASGVPTTIGRRILSCFFYLPLGASDAEGVAAATAIAALCNGTMTSVTKQVYENTTETFGDGKLNGGSDSLRVLFRNSDRDTENITIPLYQHDLNRTNVEGLFEGTVHDFVRRSGGALGQVVYTEASQVVDGVAPAPVFPP